jgi:hypothetical protein|tara:strand:- start:38 stop:424 length:387 start_codon:yes stop_codon:yes gene_type:complete
LAEVRADATSAAQPEGSLGFIERMGQEEATNADLARRFLDSPDRKMLKRFLNGQSPTGNPLHDGGFAVMLSYGVKDHEKETGERIGPSEMAERLLENNIAGEEVARMRVATRKAAVQGNPDSLAIPNP